MRQLVADFTLFNGHLAHFQRGRNYKLHEDASYVIADVMTLMAEPMHAHGFWPNQKLQAANLIRWAQQGCGVGDEEFTAFLSHLFVCKESLKCTLNTHTCLIQ